MRKIVLVVHDVRSCHNVGSLLRTADGIGVEAVYLTGYTPCPQDTKDQRLPHVAKKIDNAIRKTALGAEKTVNWHHFKNVKSLLERLATKGYMITALEQTATALPLQNHQSITPLVLVVGNEVNGLPEDLLSLIPLHLSIPMLGKKESYNVVQATAMALFQLRFHSRPLE